MEDKISIEIENLTIEGSAAALTALIGAVQGRPTWDSDKLARDVSRALCKSIRDSAAEAKQRREKRTGTEPQQD